MTNLRKATQCLHQHWGHREFKPAQVEIIKAALNGEDVLGVLPTGYGKSATYQIPAIIMEGTALVFSPLIALMQDQVYDLARRGVRASFVNSHIDEIEQGERFSHLIRGDYDIFYVAPERIRAPSFMHALAAANINFIAVDECHPAGTRITLADGTIRLVEEMCVGDTVLTHADKFGIGRISHIQAQPVGMRKLLTILTPTGKLLLTDNHKIFVEGRGYVRADQVKAGDTLLRLVPCNANRRAKAREVLQPDVLRSVPTRGDVEPEIAGVPRLSNAVCAQARRTSRRKVLQSAVLECGTDKAAGPDMPTMRETVLCAEGAATPVLFGGVQSNPAAICVIQEHAGTKPDAFTRSTGEGGELAARPSDAAFMRWERTPDARSTKEVVALVSKRKARAPSSDVGEGHDGTAGWLQGGLSLFAAQSRSGMRRCGTQHAQETGGGYAKRFALERVRVERIEIDEPDCFERDAESGGDCREVYSLTVETDHCYFAEGLLTHNCHCVSRWGHSFRPAYMRIKQAVERITRNGKRPPIIAVTATATMDIEKDVVRALGLNQNYVRVVGDPIRPNLRYKVMRDGNEWQNLRASFLDFDPANGRHIVYVGTRKGAETVCDMLTDQFGEGVATFYHAGMEKKDRIQVQDDFKEGKSRIIVATCAFGMGIDVPDIRNIVHFGIPGSVEDYQQEVGRSGRDGLPSLLTLIQSDFAEDLRQRFLDMANPAYKSFVIIWDWLNTHMDEGEILELSAAKIAERICDLTDEDIYDGTVNGVLNTLEAHGYIYRQYAGIRTTVRVYWRELQEVYQRGELSSSGSTLHELAHTLLQMVEHTPTPRPDRVNVYVEKETLAGQIGVQSPAVARALAQLDKSNLVDVLPVYTGKTTQIVPERYGEPLGDGLPRKDIERKRAREERRLEKMVEYQYTPNRVQFIREYFELGPEGGRA